jgi:hypothetical protein
MKRKKKSIYFSFSLRFAAPRRALSGGVLHAPDFANSRLPRVPLGQTQLN